MKKTIFFILASYLFLGAGCSHQIQLSPDLDALRGSNSSTKIDKNVGYYVSRLDKEVAVVTPGGGGDNVKYYPYKDTEAALNIILGKIFHKVYAIPSLKDKAYIAEKNISYIFKPKIRTNSRSESILTWPPTHFTMDLTCVAISPAGDTVWSKKVSAEGIAEFDEFKSNFSLSASRASEKAFKLMLKEIDSASVFRQ